jgi:hypothetical protein
MLCVFARDLVSQKKLIMNSQMKLTSLTKFSGEPKK